MAINADLPDLIRVALGSGLRIGELCALRWMDVNLDGIAVVSQTDMRLVPVVAVRQNVYPVKGKGLSVHDGKTGTALRIVPLPSSRRSASALGCTATSYPNGPCSRLPAGTASRPTGGRRPSAAASAQSARTSASIG